MESKLPLRISHNLRINQTEAERRLWFYLKNRQLNGVKFRRQERIDDFIVDFVSFEKRLIIEVDGGQHNEIQNIEKDEKRTQYLEKQGFRIVRYWNNDIIEKIEGVIDNLRESLSA